MQTTAGPIETTPVAPTSPSAASMRPTNGSKAIMLFVVVAPFLATIYAIYRLWNHWVHPKDLILFAVMYILVAFGVTVGFHRMLTHRSFKPNPVVEFILLVLGSMALEGPPIEWAATHIKHHADSDREGDPHSPVDGFWHAHMGWLFSREFNDPQVYAPHLLKNKMIMFVSKYFLFWNFLALAIPFAIGGWTGLLWGGIVRIFFTHHITWSVNSVCHTFGRRDYETNDLSRNQWIVGLLGMGEGWHNNHHAFPRSAFHGLEWWQIDFSGMLIRAMEKVGLVTDVYRVKPEMLARRALRGKNKTPVKIDPQPLHS